MAKNSYTSSQINGTSSSLLIRIGLCILSIALFAGCGDEEGGDGEGGMTNTQAPLSIIGEYTDPYGTIHEVSNTIWSQIMFVEGMEGMEGMEMISVFKVESYSTEDQYIIAQNSSDNEYSPSLWSRFDWHMIEDELWYCQTRYDAASADEALNTAAADSSDITSEGCGPFPWTALTPL